MITLSEIWKTTPFISLLLLAGLVQVPEELQEAAKVDGATAWQRLWKVVLPNMKAAIMVAVLFRTLDAWRIFDNPFVMTSGANDTETLSFLAYRQNVTLVNLGAGSAVSVLLFFTVVVIAFIFIKGFKTDLSQVQGRRADGRPQDQQLVDGLGRADPGVGDVPAAVDGLAGVQEPRHVPRRATPAFFPEDWTWDNFQTVFSDELFTSALRNSFGIAIIATVLSVIVAMFAAYAIARLDFRGKKLLLSMALAIAMFPQAALVGPLFNMWRGLGIYDTWIGLIIPYLTFALPLSIWTMSAFFRQIPWEMEQAAQVDGATAWQAFRKVIVPLAAPGVFTTAILTFFFCWNEFLLAISLTSTDRARTVPAALSFFTGPSQFQSPVTAIMAASVVVTIPVVIIVLIFQRRIVAGLTAGAVKG